jgi:hypothetical protein
LHCATRSLKADGHFDFVLLPEHGIKGNTHMMKDRNSDDMAAIVQSWLAERGH